MRRTWWCCAGLMLAFALIQISDSRALAQGQNPGTVSWAVFNGVNHPKANLAPNPNVLGSVEVYGNYQANKGFVLTKASFKYTAGAGGQPTTVNLAFGVKGIGAQGAGQNIIPAVIPLPTGNYQGWVEGEFKDQQGKPVQPNPISTVVQFKI
ncbi:MAG: hypothetical protein K2X82_30725 [Gemmataceae bacterium]|nr:hypothetical protein [Gemmataceae bacterium]